MTRILSAIYSGFQAILTPIEIAGHRYVLLPIRLLLRNTVEPWGEKFEGTFMKKVLQVTIYPVFLVLTFVIGFKLIENGYTSRTFVGDILMFLLFGAIFAPLEHLMPFSRKWLDDSDVTTDWMLFFGKKYWGDFINRPIRLATITILVQEISPAIGQAWWPSFLHPVLQVFLLLSVKDFFRYWYHRWMHESEFMWRWHAVHHSSTRLYWFNGQRSHPIEGLVSGIMWGLPLAFVQAPVEIVFVTGLLGRTIGRFQHTNMDLILDPFDYIFSSPKNHRYHHSVRISEGHSNYGGDVIFWDILFGTFHLPKGEQPGDEIGIQEMPNYPQSFLGLMLAPFTYDRLKKDAEKINGMSMEEKRKELH